MSSLQWQTMPLHLWVLSSFIVGAGSAWSIFWAIYENLSLMRSIRNVGFRQQIQDRLSRKPKYDPQWAPGGWACCRRTVAVQKFWWGQIFTSFAWLLAEIFVEQGVADRPEHSGSAEVIDRERTLLWHDEPQVEADKEDSLDNLDFDQSNVRAKLGILRRLLAGGLMTSAMRDTRHLIIALCACGQTQETVQHVSWKCERYADIREPLLLLESLPKCFYYASELSMC